MPTNLRHSTTAFASITLLAILSTSHVFGQASTQNVIVGEFTVTVPADWQAFSSSDAAQLRREYLTQSQQIYRQFAGADDPAKTVDLLAFHVGPGSFVLVAFTVPPTSNLISLLKGQANDKMAYGVRQGYIRQFLGLVPLDNDRFSGFYTKAIGRSGAIELSGGVEHKNLRNTIIQLTLLSPAGWDEGRAVSTLSSILDSVSLRTN
jgi:hypothetical protein